MRQNKELIQVVRQHILTWILIQFLYPWHVKSLLYLSWKKYAHLHKAKKPLFSLICYGLFFWQHNVFGQKSKWDSPLLQLHTKISHYCNVRKLALPLPKKAPDLQLDTHTHTYWFASGQIMKCCQKLTARTMFSSVASAHWGHQRV